MVYYTENDLDAISITEFTKELVKNPSINFNKNLLDDPESDFALDTADIFRQGICQIFAYALNKKYGYPVYKLQVNKSFHIFCKSNDGNLYIDVRGITPSFNEFLLGSEVEYTAADSSTPYIFEDDDFNGDYYDIGLAFAELLIAHDKERYDIKSYKKAYS